MAFTLSFEFEGEQIVARRLTGIENRAKDMTKAFGWMHQSFLSNETKQFQTQGRSGSLGWKQLSPRTVRYKAAKGLDPRILHATLRLRKSLTSKTAEGHVREIGPQEAFFGTNVDYAVHHQYGAPKASIPRRRPVEMTERQRRAWTRIAQAYLVGAEDLIGTKPR